MPEFDHGDVSHCLDYDEKTCPLSCYRARVTKELEEIYYPYPVWYSHFGQMTDICERAKEQGE